MFQFVRPRDAAVRWFLGGLLMLVCLTMVITLIPGVTSPTESNDAATTLGKVCGEKVTSAEVMERYQQQVKQSGRSFPPQFFAIYAPQIFKNIEDEKATGCEANRIGLRVSGEEVANSLRRNP